MRIGFTAEIEVFPDGATSWIARGTVRRDETGQTHEFDWIDLTAGSEAEACEVAARIFVEQVIHRTNAR